MKNRQGLIVGFYLSKHQIIHRTTIMLGSFWTVGFIRKWLLNDAKRLEARMNRADSNPDRTDKSVTTTTHTHKVFRREVAAMSQSLAEGLQGGVNIGWPNCRTVVPMTPGAHETMSTRIQQL